MTRRILLAAMAMFLSGVATAQDLVVPPVDGAAENKPASNDGGLPAVGEELTTALDQMTPEQLQALIKQSTATRLSTERSQAAAEIRDGLLFDPSQVDAALKLLNENPADTQKDNIERICKAFAAVDDRFAKSYQLYLDGKSNEAVEAFKKIVNTKESSYFSAARSYLLAESLNKSALALLAEPSKAPAGKLMMLEAIDAYKELLENMPDRVSFSASAAISCADAYDRLGRGVYAMEWYTFCFKNFALTLDKEQVDAIAEKVQKLEEVYKQPMTSVVRMMGEVKDLLEQNESGEKTRSEQEQIAMILEDLIKTIEEKQAGSASGNQNDKKDQKDKDEQQNQDAGDSQAKGDAKGSGRPSSPAVASALPGGATKRPGELNPIRDSSENGDWAQLPPREQEKLEEATKKVMSERYRDIIRDYFQRISEEKAK